MWTVVSSFALKYLWEIIAGVAFIAALGTVYWKAENWCNAACREQRLLSEECNSELKKTMGLLAAEREGRKTDRAFYDEQQASWQAQVDAQAAEIIATKQANEAVVEKHRKPFTEIFKRNTQNEQKAKVRIATEIKPSDVVTAPIALMREYNAAVARAPNATGNSGSEGGVPEYSLGAEDQVATFSALAVTEALVENINRYNNLALKCDTLVDIVVDLEARYGSNTGGVDGKAVKP